MKFELTPETIDLPLGLQLLCSKTRRSIVGVSKEHKINYNSLRTILEGQSRPHRKTREAVFQVIKDQGLLEHELLRDGVL